MNKKLSILIASINKRKPFLDCMARILKAQSSPDVEVLVSIDDGEKTIGTKRNELLQSATGNYICYVDDDDIVSPFYTTKILDALKTSPDCVGITGIIALKKEGPRKFIHSLQYKNWFEKDGIYYRCPNHLNPVKREIALATGFPNISNQEDRHYSFNIVNRLSTEVFIEEPIYYYYPSGEH